MSTSYDQTKRIICPKCGVNNMPNQPTCWNCGSAFTQSRVVITGNRIEHNRKIPKIAIIAGLATLLAAMGYAGIYIPEQGQSSTSTPPTSTAHELTVQSAMYVTKSVLTNSSIVDLKIKPYTEQTSCVAIEFTSEFGATQSYNDMGKLIKRFRQWFPNIGAMEFTIYESLNLASCDYKRKDPMILYCIYTRDGMDNLINNNATGENVLVYADKLYTPNESPEIFGGMKRVYP